MSWFFRILAATLALAGISGCTSRATETPVAASVPTPCVGNSITIGEVSYNALEVINNVLPFARYLAGQLSDEGIVCGHVKVAQTVPDMIRMINAGEVDIYWDSVFPATMVSDATGAEPILRRWRNCDPDYYSVIFTVKGSSIAGIDDLRGHMVGMDRPDSTSGLVLPAAYLIDHGLHLAVKGAIDGPVAADEVGIWFTHDDQNTRTLVLNGKLSAGATDDYHFAEWEKDEPGKLVALATTETQPRQAVLLRAGMDKALKDAIKDVLLSVDKDPSAQDALKLAAATCKYDDAPDGIGAAFKRMRAIWDQLKLVPGWQEALSESE